MNNSRAPQKMKLKWRSNIALLSKRPVQEGKRSPCNSSGVVGMQVYKALRAYKEQANKVQITIISPQRHTSAQARIPKINTHKRHSNKISARAASAKSSAARRKCKQRRFAIHFIQ
ncbi:hypothetical protein TRVL_09942 [Trypanosoma vivax]|nr:hypothetical protein TRVL_09942 [Trypanosoma vivax]